MKTNVLPPRISLTSVLPWPSRKLIQLARANLSIELRRSVTDQNDAERFSFQISLDAVIRKLIPINFRGQLSRRIQMQGVIEI